MAEITLGGNPVHTSGDLPAVGSPAPGYSLVGADLSNAVLTGAVLLSAHLNDALLVGDAMQRLQAAGVGDVCSTDSVLHATNRVRLDGLLAAALFG